MLCFKNFERVFGIYMRMKKSKHSNHKNKNIDMKYLNNIRKTRFLELEKKKTT